MTVVCVLCRSSDELNGIEFESPMKQSSRAPMLRSHSYDVDKLTESESDPDPGVDPGLDPSADSSQDPPSPPVKTRHQSNSSSADGSRHQSTGSSVDGSRHQSTGSSVDGSIGRSSGLRVSSRIRTLETEGGCPVIVPKVTCPEASNVKRDISNVFPQGQACAPPLPPGVGDRRWP